MSSKNPLSKHFRKPKIYMTVPTKGIFNPEIETSLAGDIGILSMTAMDELILKNPDALLNGEAVITVIESCVPAIKNPKELASIDVEALIIAIKYATYGSELTHHHTCSECGAISDYTIDLNYIINRFPEYDHEPIIEHDGAKLHIRPPTVEITTKRALVDLEQTSVIRKLKDMIENSTADETTDTDIEVSKRFFDSYKKIASYNIDIIANLIRYVEMVDDQGEKQIVDNVEHIREFISNSPKNVVDKITDILLKEFEPNEDLYMFEFTCPECNHTSKVKMDMNPINFS
jgi:hypothetical protein